ncbi:hypothetical protein VNI00_018214 [Paramarasmius palmivorus]|uniref:Uncharacterized protein n=1 Tax=Paramarasmius palmivorus TaxID=297713 RepID=A0AAW0AZI5_9AGAR
MSDSSNTPQIHSQRLWSLFSQISDPQVKSNIVQLSDYAVFEQFKQSVAGRLHLYTHAGNQPPVDEDYSWIISLLPELHGFLAQRGLLTTSTPPSYPPPSYPAYHMPFFYPGQMPAPYGITPPPIPSSSPPSQPIPSTPERPSLSLPRPAPITGSFTVPPPPTGNTNNRRTASYSRNRASTASVIGRAMSTAQTHARDPFSTPSSAFVNSKRIGILIYPLHVKAHSQDPIPHLGSYPPSFDPINIDTVVKKFKFLGLYTYQHVHPRNPIPPSDLTTTIQSHLRTNGMQLPSTEPDDPDTLASQPFRILDFTVTRPPERFNGKLGFFTESTLTFREIKDMKYNKQTRLPLDIDPSTGEAIPVIVISPSHGNIQGPLDTILASLDNDVSDVPVHLLSSMHQCLGWRLLLSVPILKPEPSVLRSHQRCLPTAALCPKTSPPDVSTSTNVSRPVTPPQVPQRRALELSPGSQRPNRQVRIRRASTPPSPSPTRPESPLLPSIPVTPSSQTSRGSGLQTISPPNLAVPRPPPLQKHEIATAREISRWKRNVPISHHPRENIKCEFDTFQTGAVYLTGLLQHLCDSNPSAAPFSKPPGTLQAPENPTLLAFFGHGDLLFNVGSSIGPGPRRQIYSEAVRILLQEGWHYAPCDSLFIVPPTPALASIDQLRKLRGHGALLASFLYQYKAAPLPVSPWVIMYLIHGHAFLDQLSPSLIHALDPVGFEQYSPILQLETNQRRPEGAEAIGHPLNTFLIEHLDMQLKDLDLIPGEDAVKTLRQLAFGVIFFGLPPHAMNPFQTLDSLKTLRGGFAVELIRGKTFVDTFAGARLPSTSRFVAALYAFPANAKEVLPHMQVGLEASQWAEYRQHLVRDNPSSTPSISRLTIKQLPLWTRMFRCHLHRFLLGRGVPTTFCSTHDLPYSPSQLKDKYFRLKLLLMQVTGIPSLPANSNWKIVRSIPDNVIPPMLFHTCSREIDVYINPAMQKLLLNLPSGEEESSAFDAWFFDEINVPSAFNKV